MLKLGFVGLCVGLAYGASFTLHPDSQDCSDFTLDIANHANVSATVFTLTSNCGSIHERYQNISKIDNFISYGLAPDFLLNIVSLGSNNHPDIIIDIIGNYTTTLVLIIDINNQLIPNHEINMKFIQTTDYSTNDLVRYISSIDDDVHQLQTQVGQLQQDIYSATGDVTLRNGIVNYGNGHSPAKWDIKNGFCYVTGLVLCPKKLGHRFLIGTIPEECRPKAGTLFFTTARGPPQTLERIDVTIDGRLYANYIANKNQWISLSGIAFPVN
mmetsp:Transcript_14514/g.17829  ORF Transcript_14514/g.17829 Transcript_14514/m.17829 type:complete len:270 (-) Transcript_14514:159-968(-)